MNVIVQDPFEREILQSLLACRTDTPGENPPWLDRTDGQSSIAHLRYSEMLKILPLFRERSVLVTNVPQGQKKWGWNSWTARELGDLDTPIIVHGMLCLQGGGFRPDGLTRCRVCALSHRRISSFRQAHCRSHIYTAHCTQ